MLSFRRVGQAGALGGVAAALILAAAPARADGVLEGLRHHATLASTIPDNGDLNPYAVVVAPATSGKIQQGRRARRQFQQYLEPPGHRRNDRRLSTPHSRSTTLFAKLPQNLPQCPGGIGLSTAMTMLTAAG